MVLDRRALNRATLARQLLLAREKLPVVRAVERLGGMQGQLARPPFLGLFSRIEGFRREEVVRALAGRKLVRATMMRATLHLVSARDYVAWRGALQPALTRLMRGIVGVRLQKVDTAKLVETGRAFFAEKPATFDALRAHLAAAFPGVDPSAMGYAVRTELPLVLVPDPTHRWGHGGAADYALADTFLGRAPAPAPDLAPLVRRYLAAYGPATPKDMQVWSGLLGLKPVFDALRDELVTFSDAHGRELFDLPDAPRPPAGTPAPARLLGDFDNLSLSYDDRTRIVADAHRGAIMTKNGIGRPTFLVDGFIAGVWSLVSGRLALEPFGSLPRRARAELMEEGERLASALGE